MGHGESMVKCSSLHWEEVKLFMKQPRVIMSAVTWMVKEPRAELRAQAVEIT